MCSSVTLYFWSEVDAELLFSSYFLNELNVRKSSIKVYAPVQKLLDF